MRMLTFLVGAVLLSPMLVRAADLAKIERKIVKEPAYQTKSPKYCLLVFGLDAKAKAWLVQDGDTLYVDRNGNGDLTEEGKRVKVKQSDGNIRSFEAGDLTIGGLTHSGISVMQMKASSESVGNDEEWQRVKKSGPEPWTWWVRLTAERGADDKRDLPKKISYVINGDGAGMLLFADSPKDAPIIHLNGPFTFALQDRKQRLIAGDKTMLQIGVGPQGMGPGTFAFVLYPDTIPKDAYPEAVVTFPAKSAQQKPIEKKYTLKERC
ncbi:MAG TPA: hypothetical protein VGZ25_02615 [Gemmataceae bacterium]|nr:hypothetical protein [Gemmataceae bacterium]